MDRPSFLKNTKKKICLICEGFEEYDYINRIIELGLWLDVYNFELINAESNGNLSARYQDRYQSGNYDIVLIFCDTDRPPHDDFELIKKKIDAIFGKENASSEVVIFANPCTMQIMLSHFDDVSLRTQNKIKNREIIEQLIGIKNYKANEEQRQELCSQITSENYGEMKNRTQKLSEKLEDIPSSNFYKFVVYFENTDASWIDDINSKIEGD